MFQVLQHSIELLQAVSYGLEGLFVGEKSGIGSIDLDVKVFDANLSALFGDGHRLLFVGQ